MSYPEIAYIIVCILIFIIGFAALTKQYNVNVRTDNKIIKLILINKLVGLFMITLSLICIGIIIS